MRLRRADSVWLSCVILLSLAVGAPSAPPETADPLPDGTEAATKAIATFRVPDGLQVKLFAAEPSLASPVAFCLDEQGRVYVAEEYRFNRGTEENRTRPFLLDDDLQIERLEDRLAMYKKFEDKFEGGMDWFTRWADQIRLVEDTDGDGKADRSSVFAQFHDTLDGLAAGVIAREGNIYVTCIPNLWLLKDENGDGEADVRKSLQSGFGVNAAFLGHDLHGLVWGPDGKLYFSVGDRGFHLETKEGKTFHSPRRGGVFRCNPDGSELEEVARGLRNPQELAFDQYGNLFAADNNCDKGDHSRLVYVVEGGDSGWNMAYQTIPEPYLTGPWHAEKIWHLAAPEQPASVLPPVGKLGAGPSGFTYYPGVGLPERYREHFFMCNYTGNGGIESFAVKPAGASFEIVDPHDFLKPLSATDVDFGYDGKLYVSDFVKLLWNGGSGGGRLYTVSDPAIVTSEVVTQTRELFRTGFAGRDTAELGKLLAHPDMRVRLRAQYALADQGQKSLPLLTATALKGPSLLARLHGIWGIGQLAANEPSVLDPLVPLLSDDELEIRAHVAQLMGTHDRINTAPTLLALLNDSSLRVRMHAAFSLGKIRDKHAIEPLFNMIRENADQDEYLRHAAVMALSWIGNFEAVQAHASDASAAVRMAVLLVQRRVEDPRVAQFLWDADLALVTEAARAVNDLMLDSETKKLAALSASFTGANAAVVPEALARRVINARFRLGREEDAAALVDIAVASQLPEPIRREAFAALSDWDQLVNRDRVTGYWRPSSAKEVETLKAVLEPNLPRLLTRTSGALQTDVTKLIERLQLTTDLEMFAGWVNDDQRDVASRTAALRLLASRDAPQLESALMASLESKSPLLRADARELLVARDLKRGLPLIAKALDSENATVTEKQRALTTLARLQDKEADALLNVQAKRLVDGTLPAELQLDALEAFAQRESDVTRNALAKFRPQPDATLVEQYRTSLVGGDAERGRDLFTSHRVAQCIRCHKVGETGGDAGPNLAEVVKRHPENTRQYLLESLVDPNAQVAVGFGSIVVVTNDGKVVGGILKAEDPKQLTIQTPEGKTIIVPTAEIDDRSPARSAMPEMTKVLTPRELRDIVEFLSTLK